MKRRDVVRALLTPDSPDPAEPLPDPTPRVPSQAVRAMGLEIGRLAAEAGEAAALRAQIAAGTAIVELDPGLVDPSFVTDRLAPTEDADYRHLVASMAEAGQQAPILVRPHPQHPGRYQVAYGHRRRLAAAELGVPVKAVVRTLSDSELVVAQGKENAERRDLSFIERALFAADLQARGFDRRTLNAALGVHTAEMTRFLAVSAVVPRPVVHAIGPAPKAGRPRWQELASLLARPALAAVARTTLEAPAFRLAPSDTRFDILLRALRAAAEPPAPPAIDVLRDTAAQPVIRIEHTRHGVRISVDEQAAPGLSEFLVQRLPELLRRYRGD